MTYQEELLQKGETIKAMAMEHGIKTIKLFGSIARNEDDMNSDIDLLVEFDDGRTLFDLIRFKEQMEEYLGKSVDVVTPYSVHWMLREKIIDEAIEL